MSRENAPIRTPDSAPWSKRLEPRLSRPAGRIERLNHQPPLVTRIIMPEVNAQYKGFLREFLKNSFVPLGERPAVSTGWGIRQAVMRPGQTHGVNSHRRVTQAVAASRRGKNRHESPVRQACATSGSPPARRDGLERRFPARTGGPLHKSLHGCDGAQNFQRPMAARGRETMVLKRL